MELVKVETKVDPLDEEINVKMTRREAANISTVLDSISWGSLPMDYRKPVMEFYRVVGDDEKVRGARKAPEDAYVDSRVTLVYGLR